MKKSYCCNGHSLKNAYFRDNSVAAYPCSIFVAQSSKYIAYHNTNTSPVGTSACTNRYIFHPSTLSSGWVANLFFRVIKSKKWPKLLQSGFDKKQVESVLSRWKISLSKVQHRYMFRRKVSLEEPKVS